MLKHSRIMRNARLGSLQTWANRYDGIWPVQKSRLRTSAVAACCLCLCVLSSAQSNLDLGPRITLSAVHPDANSTVDFDVKALGKVSFASIARDAFSDGSINRGNYQVELDRSSMHTDVASRRFDFTLYVNQRSLFQQSAYAYDIEEDCTGVFNDTIQSVNIQIGSERPPLTGTVSVPLHSPYGASNPLQSAPGLQKLHTGSQTVFTFSATSDLNLMAAHMGIPTASISCDSCLQAPIPIQLSTSDLPPGGQFSIMVTTTPNLWKAMSASPDATLTIKVPFTAYEQGESGVTAYPTISVPVKFVPLKIFLGLSVAGGMLLGAFLRMLLAYFPKRTWDRTQFVLGIVVAGVCWLLAMFAYSGGNSIIKLFGLSFDPTQIFPAFLLCLLVGGGTGLLRLIEEITGGKS